MDYSQAKVKVVIDFIRFRIETPDGIIRRDEHDITARDLDARIKRLKDKYSAVSDPVPVGLEIAMDVFIPGDDLDTLAEVGADLWRMNTSDISPNQRTYGGLEASRPAATPTALPELRKDVRGGVHLAEGNKDDPIYKHLYLKLDDDAGRIKVRPRIRLEFRLQGDACPFDTLDALRGFNWTELRRWFRFRELRDDLDKLAAFNASNSDRIGKRRTRDRISQEEQRRKGTREFARSTVSNQTLNRKADASLKVMGRSWKTLRAQIEEVDLPGNLEQFSPGGRASTGIPHITIKSNENTIDQHVPIDHNGQGSLRSPAPQSIDPEQRDQAADKAMRPQPAPPSSTAPAITAPITGQDHAGENAPAEPQQGEGWPYPDDPW